MYIGYTGESLDIRFRKGYRVACASRNDAITLATRKFGKENFRHEVLRDHLTKEVAWELEAYYIRYYDSMNPEKGYNRVTGGSSRGCRKSTESCRTSSLAQKGKFKQCPELRDKIREDMKKKAADGQLDYFVHSDSRPKPVICLETGIVYASIRAAIRATGFSAIQKACSGSQRTCGGRHWRFAQAW